jgi:hypothetical protein
MDGERRMWRRRVCESEREEGFKQRDTRFKSLKDKKDRDAIIFLVDAVDGSTGAHERGRWEGA